MKYQINIHILLMWKYVVPKQYFLYVMENTIVAHVLFPKGKI